MEKMPKRKKEHETELRTMDRPIDFVVTWVDGSDPAWIREKARYTPAAAADTSVRRYRDFDLLHFWFRGVERFAPWVNRIYFITWGHVPAWLNTDHPKLRIVRHADYLPPEALPCFNSNAIELGMHRMDDLAEQFVYFNDDMYLLRPTEPTVFFRDGLPVDDAVLNPVVPDWNDDGIGKTVLNNMYVINRWFDKKAVLRQYGAKFCSTRYGAKLLRTICLLPWHHLTGFYNDHLPIPYLKSTFQKVWECEEECLKQVTLHRFRDCAQDVSHWLMRYWQFCTGQFVPASPRRGAALDIQAEETARCIEKQAMQMLCINDKIESEEQFLAVRARLQAAFGHILPTPCSFENRNDTGLKQTVSAYRTDK